METNWELKDRRIGWMNCNTNAAAQIMAMATAGAYKDKDEAYIRKQFVHYRDIDYASFLDLDKCDGGATQLSGVKNGEPDPSSSHTHLHPKPVFFETASGSPASPKKGKGKTVAGWFCSTDGCGQPVSEKVYLYSNDKYGKTLCFACQDKEKERIEKATCSKDLLK